jgi:poly(hydroxyalkanoate) depolymerase family esterase
VTISFALALALIAQTVTPVDPFGTNPGNLKMYEHVPSVPGPMPLVIGLHGCGESAASFATVSGWLQLSDRYGIALALAEQQSSNNQDTCFNWFIPGNIMRDFGETASIKQMVDSMIARHSIDTTRVFVTGFSAGGAMAVVMIATYPDVFAGGGILSGVPYDCGTDVQSAYDCLNNGVSHTPMEWGDLVRGASSWTGPWPMVSIWQGASDGTVNPVNADATRKQWTNVHGLGDAPTSTAAMGNIAYSVWRDGQGKVAVEEYLISGLGHAIPVLPGMNPGQCGTTDPPASPAGVCAAFNLAVAWGLAAAAPPPSMDASVPGMDASNADAGMAGGGDAAPLGSDASDASSANPDARADLDVGSMAAADAGASNDRDRDAMPASISPPNPPANMKSSGCTCTSGQGGWSPAAALLALLSLGSGILRSRRSSSPLG